MKSPLVCLLLTIAAVTARAATFIVTNTNDSGLGSLRQAIIDADGSVNNQINFNIPGTGVQTIHLLSTLPRLAYVTIDGYSQPGAKPNSLAIGTDAVLLIEITGNKAQPSGTAFQLDFFSTIRGLVINGFATDIEVRSFLGGDAKVVGCYLETNAAGSALIPPATNYVPVNANGSGLGTTVGGMAPADRNVIAGPVAIRQAGLGQPYTRGTILGNYIGIAADGKTFLAPDASIGFFSNAVALITNNVIAGSITLSGSTGTITDNFIGTDAVGTTVSPGAFGLNIFSFTAPAGGGTGAGTVAGNVIATMNSSWAVRLSKTDASTLKGNLIGVAPDGKTLVGNAFIGIDLHDASNVTIGGVDPGDGNVIRFAAPEVQVGAGISEIGSTGHNFVEGNSISGSGGLGIDIGSPGFTPNDGGDADGIQDHPILNSVTFENGNVRVTGTLNSVSNTAFRIELFSFTDFGAGQNRSYLGAANATTDASGNASFDVTLPAPDGQPGICSTSTGPTGTSEFSNPARLKNISTRALVQAGDRAAIAGFIVAGARLHLGQVPHVVVLRALGPSLPGVHASLPDPILEFYDSSGLLIAHNDNWRDGDAQFIEGQGLAPTNDLESATVGYVGGGAYTAVVRDKNGQPGIATIEVYDVDPAAGRELLNLSTRGFVGTGDDVIIAGTILEPNADPTRIVVRALGPSLSASGISNPLANPMLELHDGQGALIAANDDWRAGQPDELTTFGFAPTDDNESAIFIRLVSGPYTAIVRGNGNATGVGLIELYNLH